MKNTLCDIKETDLENHITIHLKSSITSYKQRISDLTYSIGFVYFAFEFKRPYSELRPKFSPTNSNRTRGIMNSMRIIYLFPTDISTIYGGLTDVNNGRNVYNMKSRTSENIPMQSRDLSDRIQDSL